MLVKIIAAIVLVLAACLLGVLIADAILAQTVTPNTSVTPIQTNVVNTPRPIITTQPTATPFPSTPTAQSTNNNQNNVGTQHDSVRARVENIPSHYEIPAQATEYP
jgi:hypothetical protein